MLSHTSHSELNITAVISSITNEVKQVIILCVIAKFYNFKNWYRHIQCRYQALHLYLILFIMTALQPENF